MAKTSKKSSVEDPAEAPPLQNSLLEEEKPPQVEDLSSDPAIDTPEVVEDAQPRLEPEPQKRRPGRPSKNDPPVMRSNIIERIQNLESWEGTRVYVYRWEPYHNRQVGGRQSVSVKRYEGPFDEQDMMEDPGIGSGVYELVVNRTDPQTRKRRMIDSGMVKILNMKYPPKIPAGEWVDDPRNKEWEWARNLCEKTETPAATPVAAPVDPMVEILKDTIAAQRSEMAEIRKELRERDAAANKKDPAEVTFLSVLAPFIPAIVQRLTAPPPAPPDPIAQLNATAALIKSLTPAPPLTPAHEVDPVKLLDAQLDLSKKIQDMVPQDRGGGRSRKTGWQEVISEIAPAAAEILKPFAQVIATGMMMQQHRMAQQQAQATPQQQPQPQLPAAAPDAQQGPQQTPQAAPAPPATGPRIVKKQPTLDAFADQVLQTLQNKESGLDLGDWYLKEFGEDEFRELRLQGKEKILTDLKGAKEYRLIYPFGVSGELDKVIEDLLMWEPDEDEDDDEDDAETPPITADAMRTGWESETREETTV